MPEESNTTPESEAAERAKRRKRIRLWVLVLAASTLFLILGLKLSSPPPPKSIVLATGGKTGAYFAFGKRYAEAISQSGLDVRVVNTKGSVDNILRLLKGEAEIAFVQGGVLPNPSQPLKEVPGDATGEGTVGDALASVAAVYYEPLWVFYRSKSRISMLSQLRGKGKGPEGKDLAKGGIAVGAEGSGTLALARELLSRNGITPENTRWAYLNSAAARAALLAGEVDAAMLVTSHKSSDVQKLTTAAGVRLMSFQRHVAYTKSIPYLDRIDLAQGILDLGKDCPPNDVVLLAPAATLVCRRDLHPLVVQRFLTVATQIHAGRGLMNQAGRFPTRELVDLSLHQAAETFFLSGMPATGWMPFWLLRLVFKLKILALPLITLLLPFGKLGSVIWVFRIKSLIRRHYKALRRVESDFEEATEPAQLRGAVDALNSLRDEMARVSQGVPSNYQDQIYHWRLHVAMARDEFERRLAAAEGNAAETG